MNDFYLSLKDEHKPTIIYTTYSNIDNVNNRFRLIYVFNEPIRSNEYYRGIANTIVYNIQKEIEGFDLKDKTCLNASQQFAGNGNDNIVYYYNDNIFYKGEQPCRRSKTAFYPRAKSCPETF